MTLNLTEVAKNGAPCRPVKKTKNCGFGCFFMPEDEGKTFLDGLAASFCDRKTFLGLISRWRGTEKRLSVSLRDGEGQKTIFLSDYGMEWP